jgi:hypothetical protein
MRSWCRGRLGTQVRRVAFLAPLSLALLALAACQQANSADDVAMAHRRVEQRIVGVWRLTSYVPDQELSPTMLLALRNDRIAVRFEDGRLRSATSGLELDRPYRLVNVAGDHFTVLVSDDEGIEYESRCLFDDVGRLHFESVTHPWRGRGTLEREGPAIPRGN